MKKYFYLLTIALFLFSAFTTVQNSGASQNIDTDSITKIEMQLSAFGVESDDFPSIDVTIDFLKDSSRCHKWYFHPDYPASTYSLNKNELASILKLLKISDLEKLKTAYSVSKTDQPTSTTIIYTTKKKYVIKDYGLEGEYPLQELYKIVYRY